MDRDTLTAYLLEKPGAAEEYPFGEEAAVFKVARKMFALCMLPADPLRVNLKCDPEWAEVLRDRYEAIIPGYHMNKRHWNTVILDGSVPDEELLDLVDHSYELVVAKLPKRTRAELIEEDQP